MEPIGECISIYKEEVDNILRYVIHYQIDERWGLIRIYPLDWNKSVIINRLIRSRYSQDQVEAIINNHFLNIAEWLDKKFKGEEVVFEDVEYDQLQSWRKKCKEIANDALIKYPN